MAPLRELRLASAQLDEAAPADDARSTTARRAGRTTRTSRGGRRMASLALMCLAALDVFGPAARAEEAPGHDYPPFGTIEGFVRHDYKEQGYNFFNFKTGEDGKQTRVEGRTFKLDYAEKQRGNIGSGLEVLRTFESRMQELGGQLLYSRKIDDDESCTQYEIVPLIAFRYERAGAPVWVSVSCERRNGYGTFYELDIVEEKPFQPQTKLSQSDIRSAIDTQGKVTLHVNFDFNRATLRPDAQPTIDQVAAVMNAEPQLRLEIDGHTDAVGPDAYNQTLSEGRAKSVLASLAQSGISAARMSSRGFGASVPVGDNATEQGRAENRRVELVRQ